MTFSLLHPYRYVQYATLFREAAGVFQYLAHEVLPSLQHAFFVERPPEAIPSMSTVLCLICFAEAQVSVSAVTCSSLYRIFNIMAFELLPHFRNIMYLLIMDVIIILNYYCFYRDN